MLCARTERRVRVGEESVHVARCRATGALTPAARLVAGLTERATPLWGGAKPWDRDNAAAISSHRMTRPMLLYDAQRRRRRLARFEAGAALRCEQKGDLGDFNRKSGFIWED